MTNPRSRNADLRQAMQQIGARSGLDPRQLRADLQDRERRIRALIMLDDLANQLVLMTGCEPDTARRHAGWWIQGK